MVMFKYFAYFNYHFTTEFCNYYGLFKKKRIKKEREMDDPIRGKKI